MMEEEGWIKIETVYTNPLTLMETIWSKPKDRPIQTRLNDFLEVALKIWDKYSKRLVMNPSQISPFINQDWFTPGQHIGQFIP